MPAASGRVDAIAFDLDGTLVQTETLKAESYRRVLAGIGAEHIGRGPVDAASVRRAYASVVGRSGEEVNRAIIEAFDLREGFADALGPEPGEAPWQTLYRTRRAAYDRLLAEDDAALRDAACPWALSVLRWSREAGLPRALATMSRAPQVARVLDVLGIADDFDAVRTRDDVERGKPDPAIYLAACAALSIRPERTLILEDSASGASAGLAAGGRVLVVVNDVTRDAVRASGIAADVEAIVESDATLLPTVEALVGRA